MSTTTKSLIAAFAFSVMSHSALAYESKSGTLNTVQVSTPAYSKRNVIVTLEGVTPLCNIPSNNDSAYFNRADSTDTFNAMLSTLLLAKASGKPVRLWMIPGVEGCRIDRVDML
jgi:hypothetical protein